MFKNVFVLIKNVFENNKYFVCFFKKKGNYNFKSIISSKLNIK